MRLLRLAIAILLLQMVAAVAPADLTAAPTPGMTDLAGDILRHKSDFAIRILQFNATWGTVTDLLALIVLLLAFYGFTMGLPSSLNQALSGAAKTPLLFLLTLIVCAPVLFVVNFLVGIHLTGVQFLVFILSAMALNALLLSACAPITGFFGMQSGYHFMKLLHVTAFAICAAYSMSVLYGGMKEFCRHAGIDPANSTLVFRLWIVIYGFVGMQMAWTLRPFISDPEMPFEVIRVNKSHLNFYTAVAQSFTRLFFGHVLEAAAKARAEREAERIQEEDRDAAAADMMARVSA